jgi:hypothetical protein
MCDIRGNPIKKEGEILAKEKTLKQGKENNTKYLLTEMKYEI